MWKGRWDPESQNPLLEPEYGTTPWEGLLVVELKNWLSAWGQCKTGFHVTGGCENPGLDFPICKMGAEL